MTGLDLPPLRDALTGDTAVSIYTHVTVALFGVWAGILKFGHWVDVFGLCTPQTLSRCRRVQQIQASWQLWLTGIALGLVLVAAGITLAKQGWNPDAES